MATLRLWHGVNNESWREACACIADNHGLDDALWQDAADLLARYTCELLAAAGHTIETAYQQSVGALVINQSRQHDDIFDDAISEAKVLVAKEVSQWPVATEND